MKKYFEVYNKIIRLNVALIFGVLSVSCVNHDVPDLSLDVCMGERDMADEVLRVLRSAAIDFKYDFDNEGQDYKRDLLKISKDKSIIPSGTPVQFYITRQDGSIALMGGNFNYQGNDVMVSFFYKDQVPENSTFNKEVIAGLKAIDDTEIIIRDPNNPGISLCRDRK